MTDSPSRNWLLWRGLAVVGVLLLLAVMMRRTVEDPLKRDVERRGGDFVTMHGNPYITRYLAEFMTGRSSSMYVIRFLDGGVDDAWLQEHADELGKLAPLILTVRNAEITDGGLQQIPFNNVVMLDLQGTQISDASLPQILGVMSVSIAYTRITAEGLAAQDLSQLRDLRIDRTQWSDQLPISNFGSLTIFDADDELVTELAALNRVPPFLRLQGRKVTQASLATLKKLPGAYSVALVDVDLTPEQIRELQATGVEFRIISGEDWEKQERATVDQLWVW